VLGDAAKADLAEAEASAKGRKTYSVVVDPRNTKPQRVEKALFQKRSSPMSNPFEMLCGGPREAARACGALDERGLHMMMRRSGERIANAGRELGRAAQDASAAATLAVDDLNRHTLERVVSTVKSKVGRGGYTLRQEAPSVFARLRPRPSNVAAEEHRLSHSDHIVRVSAEHPAMAPLSFVLDGVIGGESDQAAAYAAVGADAVEALLRGESTTLIAVGNAGAGKTYTLFGPPDLLSNPSGSAWQEWGLLPRASHHLFSRASAVGGVEGLLGVGSTVSCTFVEVHDERVHDLLGKGRDLRLRESASRGVHVPGVTKRLVEWEEDVMRALVIGLQKRGAIAAEEAEGGTQGGSGSGSGSQCSHTIFTVEVNRKAPDGSEHVSRLQLVDLGTPDQPRPGTARSSRNAMPANQSLAALDQCLQALTDTHPRAARPPAPGEPNPQAIPYRDSKLTWLMRDALGGGAGARGAVHRTTFIAVCSAEPQLLPATINNLRFAHRCRQARLWVPEESLLAEQFQTPLQLTHAMPGEQRTADKPAFGRPPTVSVPSPRAKPMPTSLSSPTRLSGTMMSMQLGPGPASDSSDDGEDERSSELRRKRARDAPAAKSGAPAVVPPQDDATPEQPSGGPAERRDVSTSPSWMAVDLAMLSERSKEKVELQQKLVAVQAKVHSEETVLSPPIQHSEGWEELQSAHAHMLLLEARLAELSTGG
jgi:hypothetical protein